MSSPQPDCSSVQGAASHIHRERVEGSTLKPPWGFHGGGILAVFILLFMISVIFYPFMMNVYYLYKQNTFPHCRGHTQQWL